MINKKVETAQCTPSNVWQNSTKWAVIRSYGQQIVSLKVLHNSGIHNSKGTSLFLNANHVTSGKKNREINTVNNMNLFVYVLRAASWYKKTH